MEGYGPSSYGDAFADVYDDWYADLGDPDAVAARLADLAPGGDVLELGVGTGRLASPAAARGLSVVGVDASAAMLRRLPQLPSARPVHPVQADMSALPVRDGSFDVVLAAFNTLFNLTDLASKQRCLRDARRCLRPHGAVVVEAFVPSPDAGDRDGVSVREVGLDHVVLTASKLDGAAQQIVGQHIEIRPSGIRMRPWFLHYLHPGELDALAANAGLHLTARWGGWESQPFDDDSDVHVSVYRRAP